MIQARSITIFEGVDGSGKTTAAKAFAEKTRAVYVHFGPLPGVDKGLARIYIEAALPALLGYQDVVFDRSWLSEVPYGTVFRGGADRLGKASCRMLERLFMRCATQVVACDPGWGAIEASFKARKGDEYLETVDQLRQVYDLYLDSGSDLPIVKYDYTSNTSWDREFRTRPHFVDMGTTGNNQAKVLLVVENCGNHKEHDSWHQAPFMSFSRTGCSQWLTNQLEAGGIHEACLLWCNSDRLRPSTVIGKKVVALGDTASARLTEWEVPHEKAPHPQGWKRFHAGDPYPLIPLLKELVYAN